MRLVQHFNIGEGIGYTVFGKSHTLCQGIGEKLQHQRTVPLPCVGIWRLATYLGSVPGYNTGSDIIPTQPGAGFFANEMGISGKSAIKRNRPVALCAVRGHLTYQEI